MDEASAEYRFELLTLLNDFTEKFHGKSIILTTKGIGQIVISLYDDNLPHLLGINKVVKRKTATAILTEIRNNKITLNSIMVHKDYEKISDRVKSYYFLHDVFIHKSIQICVKVNPIDNQGDYMKLDLVFYRKDRDKCIVLGAQKTRNNNTYRLCTLHVKKTTKEPYILSKRCKIVDIIISDTI